MNVAGYLCLLVGLGLLVWGGVMDTTIAAGDLGERAHNLGLLSNRIVVVITGGFFFLAGVVLVAIDALRMALTGIGGRSASPDDHAP